ncbi:barstar family protein [Kaistella carnis]|uniref:Ribonuclease inhibitor n=1 Tax=Kaistella carnis TaxID=1241979 RepID=A0A3G8XKQ6_9FLAO|nr:barstar family protein [Kaistella carnis]AZI33093.1 ribonuclease inhibitor [Kaistella carnis]
MKNIIIEGKHITDIETFYKEINRVFMQNEDWDISQSLDAFNDLLYGGFGEIKGNEPLQLIWKNFEENKKQLGFNATKTFYEGKLQAPETYNIDFVREKIKELESGKGRTYFEIILEIISDHSNINLTAL